MSSRKLTQWVDTLDENFALCRDFSHAWFPHDAYYDKEHKSYRRILECSRCSTRRMQWIGRDGTMSANSYTYPKGYQKPSGTGTLSAADKGMIRLRNMGI